MASSAPNDSNANANANGSDDDIWNAVTKIRIELRDPGLFRWPPHVNLLYPFVKEIVVVDDAAAAATAATSTSTTIAKLRNAARNVEPFWVSLDIMRDRDSFGTFGGSTRGVLWVYPKSYRNATTTSATILPNEKKSIELEPIIELQSLLETEFPMCSESLKERTFLPHMTMSSKFDSIDDAKIAGATITAAAAINTTLQQSTTRARPLSFWCKEIYLLERHGDDGQFQRRATIALGRGTETTDGSSKDNSNNGVVDMNGGICIHDPPLKFSGMPSIEEEWVREELIALKAKRRKNHNNRRGPRQSYRARKRIKKEAAELSSLNTIVSSEQKQQQQILHGTAEEIAKKRAERKAKRERNKNQI